MKLFHKPAQRSKTSTRPAKQIYGGCGISLVQKLPKRTSEQLLESARERGIITETSQTDEASSDVILCCSRTMLSRMDLRSNGEGSGVAFSRESSSLQEREGFPGAYTHGEDNVFTVLAFISNKTQEAQLLEFFKSKGFDVRKNRGVERSRTPRDLLKGQEIYELFVVVKKEQEALFVQCCNTLNAIPDSPKVFSTGVNQSVLKIVGRSDELWDAFPPLSHARRFYNWMLGHVRFPTNTPDGLSTSQPHWALNYSDLGILTTVLGQNGEMVNHKAVREFLEAERYFQLSDVGLKVPTKGRDGLSTFLTESDGELIPHLINYLISRGLSVHEVADVLSGKMQLPFGNGILGLSGPVSVVSQTSQGLIAFRDSRRLRPLTSALVSDGSDVYLMIASEEGAINAACKKSKLTKLSVWEIKDSFALSSNPTVEELTSQAPALGTGLFRKEKDRFVPDISSSLHLEVDVSDIREFVNGMDLSTLFKQALLPGDSGKCFDDFQTYVQRLITKEIREKVRALIAEELARCPDRDSVELNITVTGLSGERHLAVGVINHLKREFNGGNLPACLKINWFTDGVAGDNLGAFCTDRTRVTHFGNAGDCVANTGRGVDVTVHGTARASIAYAASSDTTVYIEEDVGVRAGTYIKGTKEKSPTLVIGGTAGEYCGECAHNGTILVLNKNGNKEAVRKGVGAGIEGNAKVFVRGDVEQELPHGVVKRSELSAAERRKVQELIREYCSRFDCQDRAVELSQSKFSVIERDRKVEVHPSVPYLASNADLVFTKDIRRAIHLMSGVLDGKKWDPSSEHGVRLAKGMGAHLGDRSLNAAQVTAPAVDSREEGNMRKMLRVPIAQQNVEGQSLKQIGQNGDGCHTTGVIIGSQSYGALPKDVWNVLYEVATEEGVLIGSGEGGLPPGVRDPSEFLIRQLASGRFGINTDGIEVRTDYFQGSKIVEIKIGQGAKPGKGGTVSGSKVDEEIAETRGIEPGTNAISPPSHHDAYSIEDVKKLIELVRMVAGDDVKIAVKVAATNDLEQIVTGLVKSGANIINIAGGEAGTGFATKISNKTGTPALEAIERAHKALVADGLRNYVSLVVSGGFWDGAGIIDAMAHGANAVEIATAADVAMGCVNCQRCITGKCSAGITGEPSHLSPNAPDRLRTYLRSLFLELKDILQQNGVTHLSQATGNRNLIRRAA